MPRTARTAPPVDLLAGPPITDPQRQFIESLLNDRDINSKSTLITPVIDGKNLVSRFEKGKLSKSEASELIPWLKGLPRKTQGVTRNLDNQNVPPGRYAIKGDRKGQIEFYIVRHGKGRWDGWTFLDRQAGGNLYPVKGIQNVRPVLEAISANVMHAAMLYGKHIGVCSRCGRTLTNRISRVLFIGPICGGHFYDESIWANIRSNARRALEAAGLDPDLDVEDTDDLDAIRRKIGITV